MKKLLAIAAAIIVVTRTEAALRCVALQTCPEALGTEASLIMRVTAKIRTLFIGRTLSHVNTWTW